MASKDSNVKAFGPKDPIIYILKLRDGLCKALRRCFAEVLEVFEAKAEASAGLKGFGGVFKGSIRVPLKGALGYYRAWGLGFGVNLGSSFGSWALGLWGLGLRQVLQGLGLGFRVSVGFGALGFTSFLLQGPWL